MQHKKDIKPIKKPQTLLFFDTETTGLPSRDRKIRSDPFSWPRLVELGWILMSETGTHIEEFSFLVKPEGFTIPESAITIHGITTSEATDSGLPVTEVLSRFCDCARNADLLIAHNLSYDIRILLTELIRAGFRDHLPEMKGICTMRSGTKFCGIPGRFGKGFKWPSLSLLHLKLFGSEPGNAHRALDDARTCAACYYELSRRGEKMQIEDLVQVFFPDNKSDKRP
ncbi:MAG: 3'-5' exonuclease [Methanospirillum sp.]|uniref:3'-5' exonuclease n=1 Tax=Methanospirillum sp. TaxID=45200 RepID=UPI00236AFF08|nr:3'-5' exonuclease [Methanospirillum sp.]MDD1727748.1 3'-5' exonuclease [Methanospirillum sp.]